MFTVGGLKSPTISKAGDPQFDTYLTENVSRVSPLATHISATTETNFSESSSQ